MMRKKVDQIVDQVHIILIPLRIGINHIHQEVHQMLEAEVILLQVAVRVLAEVVILKVQTKKEEMKLFKIKKGKN